MPMPAAMAARGSPGGSGLPNASIDPAIGHVVTEQDVHQRRLAGAVLAEKRYDLAAPEHEADGVVGREAAEALGDGVEPENNLRLGRVRRHQLDFGSPSSTLT